MHPAQQYNTIKKAILSDRIVFRKMSIGYVHFANIVITMIAKVNKKGLSSGILAHKDRHWSELNNLSRTLNHNHKYNFENGQV